MRELPDKRQKFSVENYTMSIAENAVQVKLAVDKTTTKELGFLAENIAARHLEGQGYQVIGRNYRQPWGEIDVIAQKDDVIFFVEVKANRKEFAAGGFEPEGRVNPTKLDKIIKTAFLYMEYELKNPELAWQVDIISVTFNQDKQNAKIKHFTNVAQDYQ